MRYTSILFIGALVPVLCCCQGKPDVQSLVAKYSQPPKEIPWDLVDDSQPFWDDVEVLDKAALAGDQDAMRAIFAIDTYTDGAAAEQFPSMHDIFTRHRAAASEIIRGNDRVRKKYGHWLGE